MARNQLARRLTAVDKSGRRWPAYLGLGALGCLAAGAPAAAADVSTVKVLISGGGDYLNNVQALFNQFEKENPDLKVEVEVTGWATGTFKTRFAAGVAPDLVRMNETVDLGTLGMVEDLSPRIKTDPSFPDEDFFPASVASLGWGGHVFGIPLGIALEGLYINQDLFAAAGVPVPNGSWSWEQDVLNYGKRLTRDNNGDGLYDQFMLQQLGTEDWYMFLYGAGGSLFSADGTHFAADTQAGADALQFAADLWNVHHIAPTTAETATKKWSYAQGNVAMYFGGNYKVGSYRGQSPGFNWDVADLPTYAGNQATYLWSETPWGIPTIAKNKEGAWRLLKFLVSDEGQELVAKLGLAIPIRRSIAQSPAYTGQRPPANIAAFERAASAPHTGIEPATPGWGSIWPLLEDSLVKPVYAGTTPAKQALAAVQPQIDATLADAVSHLAVR